MKKVLFLIPVILVLSFTKSSAIYTCYQFIMTNTSKDGCERTDERHPADNDYLIFCEDPGTKVCQFSDGTLPKTINTGEIQETVTSKVENGVLQGSTDINGGYYTWKASDAQHITLSIFVE